MELSGIKKVFTEAGYQPYVGSTKVRAPPSRLQWASGPKRGDFFEA